MVSLPVVDERLEAAVGHAVGGVEVFKVRFHGDRRDASVEHVGEVGLGGGVGAVRGVGVVRVHHAWGLEIALGLVLVHVTTHLKKQMALFNTFKQ